VVCACIDIGSNTTRLLVAECVGGGLRELAEERVFTRLGAGVRTRGAVAPEKLDELVATVAAQADRARALGAREIRAVGTAALRCASNRDELCAAVAAGAGVEVVVLGGEEEARLAFRGATRELDPSCRDLVGVVDVGGGSSELVIGTPCDGVAWTASLAVGSGDLADAWLASDPPSAAELAAARACVRDTFAPVKPPRPARALAVGGSATSLRRVTGAVLDTGALGAALEALTAAPAADVAHRLDLDPRRARLLPAGIIVLEAAVACLGLPLTVAPGGLREGVLLEAAAR
jgi:exopolyphosphatase / guanosine-5'-triphosphate,3'-diphosphate pyrophosphatase